MLDRAELLPIIAAAEAPRPGAAGEPPLLLTAQDLAAKLQVSLRSVRRLDLAGRLPAPVTIGRAVRWRRDEAARVARRRGPAAQPVDLARCERLV